MVLDWIIQNRILMSDFLGVQMMLALIIPKKIVCEVVSFKRNVK